MQTFSNRYTSVWIVLSILLVVTTLCSIKFGAITISLADIYTVLFQKESGTQLTLNQRIFFDIRLPRAIACLLVGASLSMAGVLMQALFRNPIVEPGLIGTSSGAAFGASLYFVLGATFQFHASEWTLPIAACLGGALSTSLVF